MPQTVRIQHAPPGREIKQFQTHSQNDPRHNQTRPSRPHPLRPPIPHNTKVRPEQILHRADHHIRHHIIRIIESPKAQIAHMRQIQERADQRPQTEDTGLDRTVRIIEPEHPDRAIVHAVHDLRARRKVIQLLRDAEVARVEHHAERPRREPHVSHRHVVLPQRVRGRHAAVQLRHAPVVCEEVEEREDDAEWFLHPHEAVEGPFAVELKDWLAVWWVPRQSRVRHDVLAGVVAFGGAGPEEEPAL